MRYNRIYWPAAAVLAFSLIIGSGCATKKYVQSELVPLDQKVEGVEGGVEANQKRIREHDEQLQSIGSLIAEHESQLESVDGKIEAVKKYARGSLIYTETLKNDEAKFKFDSAELSAETAALLDRFVQKLIEQDLGVYLEIQGHTDGTGTESWNLLLGKKRAEAVMEYLYKKHHIPLHRMAAISFGSSAPIADNATKEGRAQNRRVDILVYE